MPLFLSADFHQGNELFSVHSRGKQCAFKTLSALLTVRSIPLSSWSKTTFNNVLLQGDKLYLKALNTGFIVLESDVDFLSVENVPTVICATSSTGMLNDFSYEISQSIIDVDTVSKAQAQSIIDSPIVVKPVEAQNIIDSPIVVKPVEAQSITDSPIVVKPIEAQTNIYKAKNMNQIFYINYKKELQGLVITDQD